MSARPNPDLRYDPPEIGGGLDELVAHNASVYLERLSDDSWCLIVAVPKGKPRVEKRSGDGRRVLMQHGERVMLYLVKATGRKGTVGEGRRGHVVANVIESGPGRWRASRARKPKRKGQT